MKRFELDREFLVLDHQQNIHVEANDANLYQRLNDSYNQFAGHTMISYYEFRADWSSWERHPKGDETVVLLSGEATIVVCFDGEETLTRLDQTGQCVVVPKGCWHTAKIRESSKLLFITPGEGTEHRSLEDMVFEDDNG